MIQFKLKDKKIQVASSWDDLDFNTYQAIHQSKNTAERLSICSGIPVEQFGKPVVGLDALLAAISFINTAPIWEDPTLKCGKYTLPINKEGKYDITYESLSQFEDMRAVLGSIAGKGISELSGICPNIVAIYLQKIRDGDYNPEKAKEMIQEVKLMPAREVVTLGSFFIIKLSSLLTGTVANSQITPQNQKKSKPVSKGSSKRSGRSQRLPKRR